MYAPLGISLWDLLLIYNWFYFLVLTIRKQKPTSYSTWMGCSFKCVWREIPPNKGYEELPGKYMILVSVAYFNDYLTASINLPCSKQIICHSLENWRKFIPILIFKCPLLQLKIP